ncbi:MAG: hypothetical protein HY840_15060 [Bacteroidetes bacterium]|nr:hypothetical protein [Bacteroidota bacterium]
MFRKFPTINLIFVAGIAAVSLTLSSCGEHKEESSELTDVEVTKDTIKSEVRINFDLIRINVPYPGELIKKLSAAKIAYNKNFLLPSGKASSYASNYQKAIGLGALGADIELAASYNQVQDAVEYLTQMSKLAGDLGINSAFDPEFSKKLLANISKPDTFQLMLDKAYDKAERNLRSNQRVATVALIVAGGWVEGLYTSVEELNTNPNDINSKSLYNDISVHCYAFNYVFQLLEAYKSNPDCAKLLQELEPSKATLLGFGKSGWGPDALPKLRETVTALRNKITN